MDIGVTEEAAVSTGIRFWVFHQRVDQRIKRLYDVPMPSWTVPRTWHKSTFRFFNVANLLSGWRMG